MTATKTTGKLTLKNLRDEIERLGITEESAGMSIEQLIDEARQSDDPMGWLAINAPAGEPERGAPEVEAAAGDPPAGDDLEADVPKPEPEPAPTIREVSVQVPLADRTPPNGYIGRHVEIRMSNGQAITLRQLHVALDAQGARLANGRRVVNTPDAVRWLLEQITGVEA